MNEAERRNEQIKDQLKSNENYRHISHLEEKLTDLIEDTKDSTITLDQLHKVSIGSLSLCNHIKFGDLICFISVWLAVIFVQEVNNNDVIDDASDKLTQLLDLLNSQKTK